MTRRAAGSVGVEARRGPHGGRRRLVLLVPLAAVGLAASYVPWEDLTEADWIYSLATRFSDVDGHKVHYPTPPEELAKLLEARTETAALRHLAEARISLGDRAGAAAAMEKWATAEGAPAWDETARWGASHLDMPLAFRAAERALPGLAAEAQRNLATARLAWARQHPDLADPIALARARVELFPEDGAFLEEWLRMLEKADRLAEADQALTAAKAMTPERRLLVRSDLLAAHGDHRRAFEVLDASIGEPWSIDVRRAFTQRVDRGAAAAPETWRGTLETRFDAAALVRLATYFQGQGRGDAAADLLRQVERRYEAGLDRRGHLLVARLHAEIDAAPEAFRATLAAAQKGTKDEQTADLAALARFALRSGGRPLAWGTYNDEAYRWVARFDRTPGFWTGGLSFLLTGQDWAEALARLESESLPDRTFATARALTDELARRAPRHAELFSLRAAIMERHVERGEGRAALALLPLVESGAPEAADQGRKIALLAARQTGVPLAEEQRLFKARLRFLAPDGSKPDTERVPSWQRHASYGEDFEEEGEREVRSWARVPREEPEERYADVLADALARLESLDRSHKASLDLILTEMDRMPDAEALWLELAARLETWSLDDDLGPRYEKALERFRGPGIWQRTARWYARRKHHADLQRLAADLVGRFRGAAIFERTRDDDILVQVAEQPRVAGQERLVRWADWVRFKALERFPHNPQVFREARRLVTESDWRDRRDPVQFARKPPAPLVVADALVEERRFALLYVDPDQREAFFASAMRHGSLEPRLLALENRTDRTPVEDLLLFEGWARLSRFERAVGPARHLAASYPGDGPLAGRVLSLHRSLNALDASQAAAAHALVERAAVAVPDPRPLWTELGELEEEQGRPAAASAVWQSILVREPRKADRVSELATLLWDYGHDAEALKVVEEGRTRLGRPRFFAFETGVLRENVKDVEGAVREYLNAVVPEDGGCFCSWFDRDQRSLRRLAQLLSRERVFNALGRRIEALAPGVTADEQTLAAFFPLATIDPPDPGLDWDVDDWIDRVDMPHDSVGRAQREARREENRPREYDAIRRVGDLLLEKAAAMAPKATAPEFLDAVQNWGLSLMDERWEAGRAVSFRAAVLARRAELAPNEEERIRIEVARARFLAEAGRTRDADQVWASLDTRIGALPEGVPKLRAEGARAGYVERTKGVDAAAAEWQRITARYPWSLGLLEDRLGFLARVGRGAEARSVLEGVIPKAAAGHREALLERLTRESLEASDLARARRAVEKLLADGRLDEPRRVGAIHLVARLSLRENAGWDPLPLAKAESAKLRSDLHADLYHEVARAADLEKAWGTSLALWIEALNRRTEVDWIKAAARSAQKGGKNAELLAFFENQQKRSPRDVRWAVAVREIKRAFHDVDGAIAAAQAAVAVRPEREVLWRDAADLMVRADRTREAAEYLEGWHRPRAASEAVATWRGQLFAQAGDGEKAFSVEQATLAAYADEAPKTPEGRREHQDRKARAATRLLRYGHPDLAFRLLAPDAQTKGLAESRLPNESQVEVAVLTGRLVRLLRFRAADADFRRAAAAALDRMSRPEVKEEVQAFVVKELLPPGAAVPNQAALDRWWTFVTVAGLQNQVERALAQKIVASRPGPWQTNPSEAYLASVGARLFVSTSSAPVDPTMAFHNPDLERLWFLELLRRDRADELLAFLEPRWRELLGRVAAATPLGPGAERVPWAAWLDDPRALEAWARAAATRAEKVRELWDVFGERRRWDRFWVLAAKGWNVTPLVAMLPEGARTTWFRFWEEAAPKDPVLVARRDSVERVSQAVGRLVQGAPQAVADPLIAKLRGPRTVGDVLGSDPVFAWAEFTPRTNAKGEIIEEGDDRVIGQGADRGRLPGALWGERPGEAWYVLEALARYRQGDNGAPRVPLESPQRGRETERVLLAIRMADAMGELPLALELEAAYPGPAQDRTWLSGQLRILVAAGEKAKARAAFEKHVRRGQERLSEEGFRFLAALADDLGLPAPRDVLDASRPLGPVLLAYLHDRHGADVAARFHTTDLVGFRTALVNRWHARERELSAEQVRYWLTELWAKGAGNLPRRGLVRLGGLWPHAADWLERQGLQERSAALEAIEEAGNTEALHPKLFTLLSWQGGDDVARLLAIRVHLARDEDELALAIVDQMLSEARGDTPLTFASTEALAVAPSWDEEESAEGEETESEAAPAETAVSSDALTGRLRAWLGPFRDAKRAQPVEERFLRLLAEKRGEGAVPTTAWKLAFELTPAAERVALAEELDAAWFRGEVAPNELDTIADSLAALLPAEAPRWLARWPRDLSYASTQRRAQILARLKDAPAVARTLFEARRRSLWRTGQEIAAFDAWRRLGAPVDPTEKAPPSWAAALPFWKKRPDEAGAHLAAHLGAHPHDVLAARAAFRSVGPLDENAVTLAESLFDGAATREHWRPGEDLVFLRLRAARRSLVTSWRAAGAALGAVDVSALARDLVRRRLRSADVETALADVGRIASKSGDDARVKAVLDALTDRRPDAARALRAELQAEGLERQTAFRVEQGRPRPMRPRDLTWPLLARVVESEASR